MSEIKIDQLKRGVKLTEEQLLDIKNGDKLTETLKEKKYLEDSQIDENEIVEFLNEADTNDDGIVTKEEFEKTELATKNNVKFSDVQKLYNKAVTVAEEEIGITTDKDGNKLVTIANWHTGKAPKDGMEVNNCLSRVAKNYKPANMSMADAMQAIINALEALKDEEDEVRENIPENLESSDVYQESERCSDLIDDAIYSVNEAMGNISEIT